RARPDRLVVVAQHRQPVRANPPPAAEGLQAVGRLGRVAAVETDPAAAGRQDVFRLRRAVGEQHHPVSGRGFIVFFQPPAQPFFGQQAADEIKVALAVLHAVAAPALAQERTRLVAQLPKAQLLSKTRRYWPCPFASRRVPVPIAYRNITDVTTPSWLRRSAASASVITGTDPGVAASTASTRFSKLFNV